MSIVSSSSVQIEKWLSTIPHQCDCTPVCKRQRHALGEMNPNVRSRPLRRRPKKAVEQEEEDMQAGAVEKDVTEILEAASHGAGSIVFRPAPTSNRAFSPTKSDSHHGTLSTASHPTSATRGRSPVKTPSDLIFVERPVRFDGRGAVKLPANIKLLDAQLKAAVFGQKCIPEGVRDLVEASAARDHTTLYEVYLDKESRRNEFCLRRELHQLERICKAAKDAQATDASEPSWNCDVHSPLLAEALELYSDLQAFNVTTARPCPDFLTRHIASGTTTESKLVDYTINLRFPFGSDDERRIIHLLNHEPRERQTITQTLYSPVRLAPAAISIETKSVQGDTMEARTQLGIWVGAHFARLRNLLAIQHEEAASWMLIPPHPLIIINADVLKFMYAFEQGDEIQVVHGPNLNVPTNIIDAYKCLNALRCLAAWAEGEFKNWVKDVLLAR